MRIVQLLSQRLLAALVLILGVLLLAGVFTDLSPLVEKVTSTYGGLPTLVQGAVRVLGGLLLACVGILGLMPALKSRNDKSRQISFAGRHGDVFIQLDSVESTITRVIGKMPEVNKIAVQVVPSDEGRKVLILADVILNNLSNIGAREAASRVSNQIMYAATHILGVDEVTGINLRVKRIAVDIKALKATPAALASAAAAPPQTIEGVEEAERAMREQIDQALRDEGVHVPAASPEDAEAPHAAERPHSLVDDAEVHRFPGQEPVDAHQESSDMPPAYHATLDAIGDAASALEAEPAQQDDDTASTSPGYGVLEDIEEHPLEENPSTGSEAYTMDHAEDARETHPDADDEARK